MIQNIPEGVDSKFRLVLLIARRAEQLMRGARPKIEADRPTKPTRLAAEEFEENRVRWDYGAEGGVLEDGEAERAPRANGSRGGRSRRLSGDGCRPPHRRIACCPARSRVVLGVSGGIAAYKAAELCRALVREGIEVQAVLTRGAREFVSPLTFAVLSGREVFTEVWGDRNRPRRRPRGARGLGGPSPRRARDGAHDRPVRARPRRRLPDDVFPLAPRARAPRARDGVGDVGTRPCGATATGSPRAACGSSGPGSGFLASGPRGRRPHGGAGRDPRRGAGDPVAASRRPRRPAAPRHGGPDARSRSTPSASSRTARAARWATRWPRRRATGAPPSRCCPARRACRGRRGSGSSPSRPPPIFTGSSCGSSRSATGSRWPPPSPTSSPEARRERLHRSGGDATVRLTAGSDVLASLRPLRRGQTVIAFAAETEDLEAPRPPEDGGEGRRPDRRQRRRPRPTSASSRRTTRS